MHQNNTHIIIEFPHQCCGCAACANICPKEAIQMKSDVLGFLYPQVDSDKCINCGACVKVCQFNKNYSRHKLYEEPIIYGCRHKDKTELIKSQSGALAFALGEAFINSGGVVYGAIMDMSLRVTHKKCSNLEELQRTRLSKYIQSDISDVYKEIKSGLCKKEKILFIGTPCQVAGLKSFIGPTLIEHLTTCDLVCHAVPSPAIWKDYYLCMEKRGHINEVVFRDKHYGWHSHKETFKYVNGRIVSRETFRMLFYNHLSVRESCSKCPFTNIYRVGDITCGDFWGWEKYHAEWNDNEGVSLAMINSDKGADLFSKANLISIKSNKNECLQPQLISPIELSSSRNSFVKDYSRYGFEYVAKKHADWGWNYIIKHYKYKILLQFGYFKAKKHIKQFLSVILGIIKR